MNNIKVIAPESNDAGYVFAVEEFVSLAERITGTRPQIIEDDDGVSNIVAIGSDAVNVFVERLLLSKKIPSFSFRFASDDFDIVSYEIDGRNVLILAGGRVRSTIYAVYTYFERFLGCRWFWDCDLIPKSDALPLVNIHITQRPRFEYRGIRYFAHRALHRFQAEHWSLEDWKREIRWMLKKRLNLFMLRIGTDDLFQRAFPDSCSYPPENAIANPGKRGYNERTSAWALKYRGEMRKKILEYAFERDLMHPEDCGTITHWYSPTPKDFIENVKPKFFGQSDSQYATNAETLVWDVRESENFERYMHLSDTHASEFGRPELFHTIGFAERKYSSDREENMRMKQHIYSKICERIERSYPGSKMLIASWDMWFTYTSDEVRELTKRLNPQNTIFFDYTSDNITSHNFTNWGVVGSFPYVAGIFHGFSRDCDIRGNYSITDKRLAEASSDPYCKGLIFWPELSHSDTFMLEYFTDNAWSVKPMTHGERIEKYCSDRYGERAGVFENIWKDFFPVASLMHWNMDGSDYDNPMEYWVRAERVLDMHRGGKDFVKNFDLSALEENRGKIANVLRKIAKTSTVAEHEHRDMLDIARTSIGRYIHGAIISALTADCPEHVEHMRKKVLSLTELMWELLTTDKEYSMLATCEKMAEIYPINPAFYDTIKENASCAYHRSAYMEQVKSLYIPELSALFDWIANKMTDGDLLSKRFEEIHSEYMKTPLTELAKHGNYEFSDVLLRAADLIDF